MAVTNDARLTVAEGRKFALTVGAAFLAIALVLWWRRGPGIAPTVAGGLGFGLALAAVLVPGHLTPIHRAWMGFATLISRVTTPIMMAVIYFGVLTPIGFLRRKFGRDPLIHRADAEGSYWRAADPPQSDLKRQF